MADLSVNIGKLEMSNPVMTASGTFGYGLEFQDFVDLEKIVAFLREFVPGFENCFLITSASFMGVRETRHFEGVARLTEQDILEARQFPDWVVKDAHFNFDVHNISGSGLDETGAQKHFSQQKGYDIPIGCLIPKHTHCSTPVTSAVNTMPPSRALLPYFSSMGGPTTSSSSMLFRKCSHPYLYSPDGIAEWPAQAINYTNKTQYIFRIAKGIFNEYDERVNDSMNDSQLYIPYENFVYIGDSATDIPCMRLVKSKGGYSIGVYDPDKKVKDKVYKLYADGRLSYYTAADYSAHSELMSYIRTIVDEIAAKENIKTEQQILNINASIYKMMVAMEDIKDKSPDLLSKKEQKLCEQGIREMRDYLDGKEVSDT